MSDSLGSYKVAIALFSLFAGIALLLAAIGIYGVMAFNVTQRTHEIGVRMALGAQHHDVIKLVLRQGAWIIALGLVIGLIASFAVARVIGSNLYNTSPYDPLTLTTIIAFLGGVAFLACWLPVRRATKVDPMIALRAQ